MCTLGDLTTILDNVTGQPLPQIFLEATGNAGAAFGLFFMSEFIGTRLKIVHITDSQSSSSVLHVV